MKSFTALFFLLLYLVPLTARDPFRFQLPLAAPSKSDEKVIVQSVSPSDEKTVGKEKVDSQNVLTNQETRVIYEDEHQRIIRSARGTVTKLVFPD
jgi:hypothetical protein